MSQDTETLSRAVESKHERMLYIEALLLAGLALVAVLVTARLSHQANEAAAPRNLAKVEGLVAATAMTVKGMSPDLKPWPQDTAAFRSDSWVVAEQLFAPNQAPDGWLELTIPNVAPGLYKMTVYMTKSTDYGIVQLSLDGQPVGEPIDLYDRSVVPLGPIVIGKVEVKATPATLKIAVSGKNASSGPPYYQFGIQGVVLTPEP
jgi:hypothetical protein